MDFVFESIYEFHVSHLFVSTAKCYVEVDWELCVGKGGWKKFSLLDATTIKRIFRKIKGWLKKQKLSAWESHLYQQYQQKLCPCLLSRPACSSCWAPRCAKSVGRSHLSSPCMNGWNTWSYAFTFNKRKPPGTSKNKKSFWLKQAVLRFKLKRNSMLKLMAKKDIVSWTLNNRQHVLLVQDLNKKAPLKLSLLLSDVYLQHPAIVITVNP